MKRLISLLLAVALCAGLAVPALAAEEVPFTDVAADAWYAEAASWCAENELMAGVGGGAFAPDTAMSRGMLVTVLYRLAGKPEAGEVTFPDVPAGTWYTDAAAWAAGTELSLGLGDGAFHPDDPVTRAQMVTILWRYAGCPKGKAEPFSDQDAIADWAVDAVVWARSIDVVNGVGGDCFAPETHTTRAQAAAILYRFCQANGMGGTAAPCGIVLTDAGTLLVTDTANKVIWQAGGNNSMVYAGGISVLGLYGEPLGGYNDGERMESYFKEPWAIAPFLGGWAVTDAANNAIRLVRGNQVGTLNCRSNEPLKTSGMGVVFERPTGLAADGKGNLYVSDTLNNAVRKITPEGLVTTVVRDLKDPMGLCWKDGSLYIAETGANRIVKLTGGTLTVVAGSGEADCIDGAAGEAAFCAPQGVAVDDDGTVYVADTVNSAVRRIKDGVVTTLVSRDRTKLDFFPVSPIGLAIREGKLYVCDNFSCKVVVVDLSER